MIEQIKIAIQDIESQVKNLEIQKSMLLKLSDNSIPNIDKWKIICCLNVSNKDSIAVKFLKEVLPGADTYLYTEDATKVIFRKFVVNVSNFAPYSIEIDYNGVARNKYPEVLPATQTESVYSTLLEAAEKGASTDSMAKYLFPKSGYIVRNVKFLFVKRRFPAIKKMCEEMKKFRYEASHRILSEYNEFQNNLGEFDACFYKHIRNFANKEAEIKRVYRDSYI
jgi:hypothetical protein